MHDFRRFRELCVLRIRSYTQASYLSDGYTLINQIAYTTLYTYRRRDFAGMENQPKQVISFRVSAAEMAALESLQQPDDKSISKTALRLLQGILGVQPDTLVNAVDADGIKDRVESLEEKLNKAIITREYLSIFVNDIVDKRIHHLVNALSDHENRLLGIEQAQEKQSLTPVTAEVTTQEVTLALLQDKENAIAPEATEENITLAVAGNKISAKKLKSVATSIQNTFRSKGIEISQTIIKNKITEMYPNSDDWLPHSDARRDVIRAVERAIEK